MSNFSAPITNVSEAISATSSTMYPQTAFENSNQEEVARVSAALNAEWVAATRLPRHAAVVAENNNLFTYVDMINEEMYNSLTGVESTNSVDGYSTNEMDVDTDSESILPDVEVVMSGFDSGIESEYSHVSESHCGSSEAYESENSSSSDEDTSSESNSISSSGTETSIPPSSHQSIPFANYVELCSNASTLQERVALLLTGRSAIKNIQYTVEDPVSVNAGIIYNFDYFTVDAIVYGPSNTIDCQNVIQINVVFSSKFETDFKAGNCGSINMKSEYFGSFSGVPESIQKFPVTPFMHIPNMYLGSFGGIHKFKIHVFFPKIYIQAQVNAAKRTKCSLSYIQRKQFVDFYFLPALKESVVSSVYNKFHADFEEANSATFGNYSTTYLSGSQISKVINVLKTAVGGSVFVDFFFVLSAFGGKESINIHNLSRSGCFASTDLDWESIDIDKMIVDVGVDGYSAFNVPVTGMAKENKTGLRFGHLYEALSGTSMGMETPYPFMLNYSFGGFNFQPRPSAKSPFTKIIGYSDFKNPFYKSSGSLDRRSEDFVCADLQKCPTKKELYKKTRTSEKLLKNMNNSNSFRLEFRSRYTYFKESKNIDAFLQSITDFKTSIPFIFVRTSTLFSYAHLMLTTIFDMLPFFSNSYDPHSISAVIVLTYILNSILHAPPTYSFSETFDWRKLGAFIQENRSSKTTFLHLPHSFFPCQHGRIISNFTLPTFLIKQLFPYYVSSLPSLITSRDGLEILSLYLPQILSPSTTSSVLLQSFNIPDMKLYDTDNPRTNYYVKITMQIFKTYGLSNMSAILFMQIMFTEYLELLSPNLFTDQFKKYRPNFKLYSFYKDENIRYKDSLVMSNAKYTSLSQTLAESLLIFFPFFKYSPSVEEIISTLHQKTLNKTTSRYGQFGSRAVYLQLYANQNIPHYEIYMFHTKVVRLMFMYATLYPICHAHKIFVNKNGLNMRHTRGRPDCESDWRVINGKIDSEPHHTIYMPELNN